MFRKNKSITLVEVCVGIVVLSIAITAIVQVFYLNSLMTTAIRSKSILLNYLENYAEATLMNLRTGNVQSAERFSRDEFTFSRQFTNLGNNLILANLIGTWPKLRPQNRQDSNTEALPFLAISFASDKEVRTTQEEEGVLRLQFLSGQF